MGANFGSRHVFEGARDLLRNFEVKYIVFEVGPYMWCELLFHVSCVSLEGFLIVVLIFATLPLPFNGGNRRDCAPRCKQ